jgi:glycine cleavage system pyridoxal-binding protein P
MVVPQHAAYFATKKRRVQTLYVPGESSGLAVNTDGNRACVWHTETREQHIKRGKATHLIFGLLKVLCL